MTQIKVNYQYETLLLLLKREMHQREIAKELKTSLTRIQSILKELRNINAVDYREVGKNHIYFIKKNLVSRSLILNAENYKLIRLLRKHPALEQIFKQIIKICPDNMILLFGSYANGTEKKDSDIDIYIETTDNKLKDELQKIHHNLSIKIGQFNPDDLLIKEVIKNHIILQKGEEFYEKTKFLD